MLTQKERIDALRRKLKKHSYFEEPLRLNRDEAALVINILDKAQERADKQHKRYMDNQEYFQQLGRERYAKKKDEINEKRRQARYLKEVEDAFK